MTKIIKNFFDIPKNRNQREGGGIKLTCLDVGPNDGIWSYLLGDSFLIDGCEIFEPYIVQNKLPELYRVIFNQDIKDLKYFHYDLIIFGDVIEHIDIETAKEILDYAYFHCTEFIVALPFLYKQDAINGNIWEIHKQDDLTPEIIKERYPMLTPIEIYNNCYGYYSKNAKYKEIKENENR